MLSTSYQYNHASCALQGGALSRRPQGPETLKEVEIRLKFLQGDYCDVDELDDDAETKKEKAAAREDKKSKRTPLTLLSSRIVLDQLIDLFPSMKSHLAADAPTVHNRDFENAVIKIQTNKEDKKLTATETKAVKVYLLAPNAEEEYGSEVDDFTDMIARLEKEAKASKAKSKYRSLAHISPTSFVVERLFSRAKLNMTPITATWFQVHSRCYYYSATTRICGTPSS